MQTKRLCTPVITLLVCNCKNAQTSNKDLVENKRLQVIYRTLGENVVTVHPQLNYCSSTVYPCIHVCILTAEYIFVIGLFT